MSIGAQLRDLGIKGFRDLRIKTINQERYYSFNSKILQFLN
jgi:hypothetical protein